MVRTSWLNSLIAGTAPRRLGSASELDSSETVGEAVIDSPRALVSAHEGSATRFATVFGCHIGKRVITLVTALNRRAHGSFARPSARGLAAVPISSCLCAALGIDKSGAYRQGHDGELLKEEHDERCVIDGSLRSLLWSRVEALQLRS